MSIPVDPSSQPRQGPSKPPSKDPWDDLSPEARERAVKALARVNRYIEAGEIELDDDAHALIKLIVEDGVNAKVGTNLDREWAIRTAIRRMYDPRLDPRMQQRCFEFACELMGHVVTGSKSMPFTANVIVESLNKGNA